MSLAASTGNSGPALPFWKVLALLGAATIACLLAWINKAYCVDDPMYLWGAMQIQSDPLDFYGCNVNWFSTVTRFYEAMQNPPLACYYLAGTAAIVGWSEPAVHAAFLLPAVGTIWGTWFLARSLCRQAVSAALLVLVTPAFLVSATNVTNDTMMVCLWTWAVALWVNGLNSSNGRWLGSASLLVAAAALTKYSAVSLIPLLAVYTVLRDRKFIWRLGWLLVPVVLLVGYQAWTRQQYGRGLLSDAAAFAWKIAAIPGAGDAFSQETTGSKTLVTLAFTGGSFLPVLFCAPWLWSKSSLAAACVAALATNSCARCCLSQQFLVALHMPAPFTWTSAAQLGVFTSCGALALWLALSDLAKNLGAEACLLSLWVLGTFVFAGFVNWTCNVRSVLPMLPALGILVMRRLEWGPRQSASVSSWRWALVPSLAAALMVAWADFRLANSARTAARQIADVLKLESGTVWFQGHWGFQYYMAAEGGRAVDLSHPECRPGDVMITPYNNTSVVFYSSEFLVPLRELELPVCGWLSTVHGQAGAGFYAAIFGPMPFAIGPTPPEKYVIWQLKLPDQNDLPRDQALRPPAPSQSISLSAEAAARGLVPDDFAIRSNQACRRRFKNVALGCR